MRGCVCLSLSLLDTCIQVTTGKEMGPLSQSDNQTDRPWSSLSVTGWVREVGAMAALILSVRRHGRVHLFCILRGNMMECLHAYVHVYAILGAP